MLKDRSIRRLTALEKSGSTARILNLRAIHKKYPDDENVKRAPFFKNKILNQSIILKHRLRSNEYEYFEAPKATVTKILVPIDSSDLRSGAYSVLIGQRDFDDIAASVFGDEVKPGAWDRRTLDLIDSLPSLDPFLLRDQLLANETEPARVYFAISDADIERMFAFVRDEIMALVSMSAGSGRGAYAYATRLVEKLLSSAPSGSFEPLKDTLKLSDREYIDGVYAWRGFLYYKWVLSDLVEPIAEVVGEIGSVRCRGSASAAAAKYLPDAQKRISKCVFAIRAKVAGMIAEYSDAYQALTTESKPAAFRSFLLDAPSRFVDLGEQLGALQHVMSFWRFRFPRSEPVRISPDDFMDVLSDFEDSLSFTDDPLGASLDG